MTTLNDKEETSESWKKNIVRTMDVQKYKVNCFICWFCHQIIDTQISLVHGDTNTKIKNKKLFNESVKLPL